MKKGKLKSGKLKWIIIIVVIIWIILITFVDVDKSGNLSTPLSQSSEAVSINSNSGETEENTSEGNLGDYYVKIKGCTFAKDYEGKKIIIINYDFTNNSDETIAPFLAVHGTAFQDGIELDTALTLDSSTYDIGRAQKEVKSGTTIEDCQDGFVLSSTSPVEYEMSKLISFSDETLEKTFEVQ